MVSCRHIFSQFFQFLTTHPSVLFSFRCSHSCCFNMQAFPCGSAGSLARVQPMVFCTEPSKKPWLTEYQDSYTAVVRSVCVCVMITKLALSFGFFMVLYICLLLPCVSPPSGPGLRSNRVTFTTILLLVSTYFIFHSEPQDLFRHTAD